MAKPADIYCPLDEAQNEIRLIRITYDDIGKVCCSLKTFCHKGAPPYIALSYAWTASRPTQEILLDGNVFFVRPNLHRYLKQAQTDRSRGWIFIDALCINQADEGEKGCQIRMMSRVFRGADKVVAWLGMEYPQESYVNPDSIAAFELFCDVNVDFCRLFPDHRHWYVAETILAILLPCSCWSRLWIVQEILTARDLTFQFRRFKLSWERIRSIPCHYPTLLSRDKDSKRFPSALTTGGQNLDTVKRANLFLFKKEQIDDTEGRYIVPLSEAITMLREQHCREKSDKIFGLLAVTRSILRPNYSMPTIELYLRVFIECAIEWTVGMVTPYDCASKPQELVPVLQSCLGLSNTDSVVAFLTAQAWKQLCTYHVFPEWGRYNPDAYADLIPRPAAYKLPWLRCARFRLEGPNQSNKRRTLKGWTKYAERIYDDVYRQLAGAGTLAPCYNPESGIASRLGLWKSETGR